MSPLSLNLHVKQLDPKWKVVARTALLDAIVWVWFHQTSYSSRFTETYAADPALLGSAGWTLLFTTLFGVLLIAPGWNRVPVRARVGFSVLAAGSVAAVIALSLMGLSGTSLSFFALLVMHLALTGCQILRLENLAKAGGPRALMLSLFGSFILFYALSALLIIAPEALYDSYMIAAPLVLLIGYRTPLSPAEYSQRLTRKLVILPANVHLIIMGVAAGVIYASEGTRSATSLAQLFVDPSPVFLIMMLLYMELGIVTAAKLKLQRGVYFAFMGLTWSLGSFLGSIISKVLPGVPSSTYAALAAAVVLSFFVFEGGWERATADEGAEQKQRVESVVEERKLTKREREVLDLLLEGRSLPYIQKELYISEGTARTHASHLYSKLGVHNRQELIDLVQIKKAGPLRWEGPTITRSHKRRGSLEPRRLLGVVGQERAVGLDDRGAQVGREDVLGAGRLKEAVDVRDVDGMHDISARVDRRVCVVALKHVIPALRALALDDLRDLRVDEARHEVLHVGHDLEGVLDHGGVGAVTHVREQQTMACGLLGIRQLEGAVVAIGRKLIEAHALRVGKHVLETRPRVRGLGLLVGILVGEADLKQDIARALRRGLQDDADDRNVAQGLAGGLEVGIEGLLVGLGKALGVRDEKRCAKHCSEPPCQRGRQSTSGPCSPCAREPHPTTPGHRDSDAAAYLCPSSRQRPRPST